MAAQDTEYTMWDQNYFEVPFDISLGFYLGGFHLQLLEFPYVYQFYSRNKKNSTSMHRVKSATLEIANLALLTPCKEFENFCDQIPSFEVL